jgi:tetratricopeptide (TPR) repeat protein
LWYAHQAFKARHWEEFNAAGNRAFGRRNYPYAEKMYREALQRAEDLGPRNTRVIKSLTALRRLYKAQGKSQKADSLLARARALRSSKKR